MPSQMHLPSLPPLLDLDCDKQRDITLEVRRTGLQAESHLDAIEGLLQAILVREWAQVPHDNVIVHGI